MPLSLGNGVGLIHKIFGGRAGYWDWVPLLDSEGHPLYDSDGHPLYSKVWVWGRQFAVPANALVTADGIPLVTADGNYLITVT